MIILKTEVFPFVPWLFFVVLFNLFIKYVSFVKVDEMAKKDRTASFKGKSFIAKENLQNHDEL